MDELIIEKSSEIRGLLQNKALECMTKLLALEKQLYHRKVQKSFGLLEGSSCSKLNENNNTSVLLASIDTNVGAAAAADVNSNFSNVTNPRPTTAISISKSQNPGSFSNCHFVHKDGSEFSFNFPIPSVNASALNAKSITHASNLKKIKKREACDKCSQVIYSRSEFDDPQPLAQYYSSYLKNCTLRKKDKDLLKSESIKYKDINIWDDEWKDLRKSLLEKIKVNESPPAKEISQSKLSTKRKEPVSKRSTDDICQRNVNKKRSTGFLIKKNPIEPVKKTSNSKKLKGKTSKTTEEKVVRKIKSKIKRKKRSSHNLEVNPSQNSQMKSKKLRSKRKKSKPKINTQTATTGIMSMTLSAEAKRKHRTK